MSSELLLENFNNEQQNIAVLSTAKLNVVEDKISDNNDFDNIIAEKTNDIISADTEVFSENTDLKENISVAVNNFMEIINNAAEEIGIENSLNLTLEEGVEDLISEFKNVEIIELDNLEELEDVSENITEIISASIDSLAEKNENIEDTEEQVETEISDDENEKNDTEKTNIINTYEKIVDTSISTNLIQNKNNQSDFETEIKFDENLLNSKTTTSDTTNVEFNNLVQDTNNSINKILPKENSENTKDESSTIEEILGEDKIEDLKIESIESEVSDGSNNNDTMQGESAEEHSIKAILNTDSEKFELNAEKTVSAKPVIQAKTTEISNGKIIEQITKHLDKLNLQSKINMVLNPESLGKVSIQLIKSPEGLSAQFTVATQEARELLMKNVDGLRESLISHGMNVDNLNVKLSDTQKSSYNTDWTEQDNSQNGNKNKERQNNKNKNSNLFEQMMTNNTEQNENEEKNKI